jgi:tetratricopeptide (TPR) repeat protein
VFMSTSQNPIEQRIEYLASLWNEFAKDSEPRLLRWLVDNDGAQMVDLLIEIQSRGGGEIPDLFLRFSCPFGDANSYALELLNSLRTQYQESQEELISGELPADWQCPEPLVGESGLEAFVRACISFKEYYRGKMLTLALALTPSQIANPQQWQQFLHSFLIHGLPQTIRTTVIDHLDNSLLSTLCQTEPQLTRTVTPQLDMHNAVEEIAASAEGVGPGNDFRLLYVKLGNAISKKDTKSALAIATDAMRIAKRQKWYDLQVAVQMMLGGMYLGEKNSAQALTVYGEAEKLATEADQASHPAGKKLLVQTKFAQGGALVSNGKYAQAAPIYQSAAPIAHEQSDAFLELEAWRMASYCYESAQQFPEAWQCGNSALAAGELLDKDMRQNSTLPYVGKGLLNILQKYHHFSNKREQEQIIRNRLVSLVGEDWEGRIEKPGAVS